MLGCLQQRTVQYCLQQAELWGNGFTSIATNACNGCVVQIVTASDTKLWSEALTETCTDSEIKTHYNASIRKII
jgi:hypothetical protein